MVVVRGWQDPTLIAGIFRATKARHHLKTLQFRIDIIWTYDFWSSFGRYHLKILCLIRFWKDIIGKHYFCSTFRKISIQNILIHFWYWLYWGTLCDRFSYRGGFPALGIHDSDTFKYVDMSDKKIREFPVLLLLGIWRQTVWLIWLTSCH